MYLFLSQMHIKYKRKEGVGMNMNVHTEPGGIFGNVISQPEIFPGFNDVSGITKLICQGASLKRQHREYLKAADKKFNRYNA